MTIALVLGGGAPNLTLMAGVEALLRELDTLFLALEGEYKPRVVYVKTQGTLIPPQSIDDKISDWANELHPTEPGFEKIATKFLAALRNSFPSRI